MSASHGQSWRAPSGAYGAPRGTGFERGDRLWPLLLFCLGFAYVAWHANGLVSSNDGSNFALVRSLSERGSGSIDGFQIYTAGVDLAHREGRLYSERAPFTGFAAAPFALAVHGLARAAGAATMAEAPVPPGEFGPQPEFPVDGPEVRGALFVSHAAFGAVLALLFLACRRLGLSPGTALFAALLYGLGTVAAKYGATLFTHGPAAALVLAGALLAADAPKRGFARGFAAGLALGLLPGSEYAALVLVPLAGGLPFLAARPWDRTWRRAAAGLALGLLPGALLLATYNSVHFGAPWVTAQAFNLQFEWVRDAREAFAGPLGEGLAGLLASGPNRGLLVSAPLLALWPLGIWRLARGDGPARRLALLLALLPLVFTCTIAKYLTWWGGGTADTRYLLPVLPLLVLGVAPGLEALWRRTAPALRPLLLALGAGLLSWSALHQYVGLRFFLLDPWSPEALLFGPGWALSRANWGGLAVLLPQAALLGGALLAAAGCGAALPAWRSAAPWGRTALLGGALVVLGTAGSLLVPGALVAVRGL